MITTRTLLQPFCYLLGGMGGGGGGGGVGGGERPRHLSQKH